MKSFRWFTLVAGILLVVLGFIMLGTPVENLVSVSLIIFVSLFIYGIFTICAYFSFDKVLRSAWVLMLGILSVLLGLWMLISGDFVGMMAFLPFMFAVWLMVSSISMAIGSIDLKNIGIPGWGWQLAIGIIGTVLGFLLISAPIVSALTLSYMLAFVFIYRGISDIALFFTIKPKNI